MGLDMFGASHRAADQVGRNFHYWRGHHQLHNWMLELYLAKCEVTKTKDEIHEEGMFSVQLDHTDLAKLETFVRSRKIKDIDMYGDDGQADDLKFINEARKRLMTGLTVIYHADW